MSQYGDGDYCTVHDTRWHTARKPHKCGACAEVISAGHRYHVTFYIYDNTPYTTKRCVRCQAIYEHLNGRIAKEGDCEEFCDDQLACGHEYVDRWREEPPPEIAALAFWRPGDPLPKVSA